MTYRLRAGVHHCICGEQSIFLDVDRGRYFTLAARTAAAFRRLLNDPTYDTDLSAELQSLIARELLVWDPAAAGVASSSSVARPAADLFGGHYGLCSGLTVARALIYVLTWEIRIRRRPLAGILALARAHSERAASKRMCDPARLQQILAGFRAADLVVKAEGRCLPRSLALLFSCHRTGFRPLLIFGVRANPFSAHCWLQIESHVVGSSFEQARLFTPILTIS